MAGSGFEWYDTGQSHIVTRVTFRNCGVHPADDGVHSADDGVHSADDDGVHSADDGGSVQGAETSAGCGDGDKGCLPTSSVWLLLTHSDEHVPEFMQVSK